MCFVFICQQRTTCVTYSINWLGFITQLKSVYCAVRTWATYSGLRFGFKRLIGRLLGYARAVNLGDRPRIILKQFISETVISLRFLLFWCSDMKLSLSTLWRHIGRLESKLHLFWTSAVGGCEWLTSCPGCFTHWREHCAYRIGGCVGPSGSLDVSEKRKLFWRYSKVKFTLEQATKDQMGGRGISTLSLTSALHGGGWSTPRPGRFTPDKDPIPIV
jgi:hypothetical protein